MPSPPYHCQFVLVMKLTATLNAPSGDTPERSVGLNGKLPWNRWTAYTTRNDTRLNARSAIA